MLDIGSRRELFIDNLLIDRLDGASLKLQTPRPGGVAVRFGAAEGDVDSPRSGYTTVLKDGDTYRLYYRGRGYERTPRWIRVPDLLRGELGRGALDQAGPWAL